MTDHSRQTALSLQPTIKNLVSQLEIKISHYISQSPASVYQASRVVKTSFDRLELLFNNYLGKTPILIYQMGRVGSTSIFESLKLTDLSDPIYHVHCLTQASIDQVETKFRQSGQPIPRFIVLGKMLIREMRRKPQTTKWRVVTLLREPISTMLSQMFYDPEVHHPKLFDQNGNVRKEDAIDYAQERLANFDEATWYLNTWFSKEFKPALNVDVYDYSFQHQNGYSIIESEGFDILILRLEDLKRNFNQAMRDFLDIEDIKLIKTNSNENRSCSAVYQYVRDHIVVPEAVCDRIYSSQYAKHFYKDRLHELTQTWTRQV